MYTLLSILNENKHITDVNENTVRWADKGKYYEIKLDSAVLSFRFL